MEIRYTISNRTQIARILISMQMHLQQLFVDLNFALLCDYREKRSIFALLICMPAPRRAFVIFSAAKHTTEFYTYNKFIFMYRV